MDWRNPAFNAVGTIDCEVYHPTYGWVPFTVDPADDGAAFDVAALDASIRAAGGIAAYAPPEVDPAEARVAMYLTRRQILIALASEGFVSAPEAVAWATSNTLPAAIEALVSALPTVAEQTAARITLASFTVAYRLDPLVAMLAAVAPMPLDDAALDAFFAAYAAV